MIEFNLDLEKLNESLIKIMQLRKTFCKETFATLVSIFQALDPTHKGYLIPIELVPIHDPEFQNFITQKLGNRISYSLLVAYIQKNDNFSSIDCGDRQEKLNRGSFQQLILQEYRYEQRKKRILENVKKYVTNAECGIDFVSFEEYCHRQKLLVNPREIFRMLYGNEQKIEWHFCEVADRMGANLGDTEKKISNLNSALWRLSERVEKFGIQWF